MRDRSRPASTRRVLGLAALALVVAGLMVWAMAPDVPGPDPVGLDPAAAFTPAQVERARAFRGPQRWLGSLAWLLGLIPLVWLVARPPRWFARAARRPVLLAAGVAAACSTAAALAPLPVVAIARQRSLDIGLSTRSWPGWLGDVALSVGIGSAYAAVGGAVLAIALRRLGRRWWVAGAAVAVAFGAATTFLAPVVIDPRFNAFTPLRDGPVRREVLELARRADVRVGEVYVVDASKRTSAANAYVAGLGRTKRVVIYDTLLERFPRAELRHVVAHELGHVAFHDVPRGLLWVAVVAPFGMLAAARAAERLGPSDWRARPHAAVPAVGLVLALAVPALTTVSDALSRRVEARADGYALELTREPRAMVDFQRRVAIANVLDPLAPRWARWTSTHPAPMERIGAAVAFERALRRAGAAPRAAARPRRATTEARPRTRAGS